MSAGPNKVDLSAYDNSWYRPGGPIKRGFWYFFNLIFVRNKYQPFNGLRVFVLRLFGARIGSGVVLKPGINIKYPWLLSIGDHSWIGEDVWIDNLAQITIGSDVCISQGAMLLCGNHNYKSISFDLIVSPILLESGSWVGAQSTVCPGVTLGSHAILTVGSVAVSDLEPYGIYQGNPAAFVKTREISQ